MVRSQVSRRTREISAKIREPGVDLMQTYLITYTTTVRTCRLELVARLSREEDQRESPKQYLCTSEASYCRCILKVCPNRLAGRYVHVHCT
jgi:hypothetical protein